MPSAPRSSLCFPALAGVVALAALGWSGTARADASAADQATAEALFEHAKKLMKEGHYAEACPKLAESQRLDAGLGTMLNLADCYDKNGQTASAWAVFTEAAALAHSKGQADRERKARERVADLEGRLNRLSISPATGADLPGIEIRCDGRLVNRAEWGTPVPFDPGEHTVVATAPGKQPWSVKVKLTKADTATNYVVVPLLYTAHDADKPPPDQPKVEPPKPEPPKPQAAPPRVVRPLPAPPPPQPPPQSAGASSARVAGYAMMGVGLATAAVGGVLGAVALLKKSSATPTCRADNVCTPDAIDDLSSARDFATATDATLGAGGGMFAIGVIILIATRPAESIDKQALRVRPLVGPGVGGLSVGGAF